MKTRNILALLMALVMAFSLTACGGSSYNKGTANDSAAMDSFYGAGVGESLKSEGSLTTDSSVSNTALPENRKLIRTISMDAETEELEPLLDALNAKIESLGGYVESRNIYNGSTYASRRYRPADLTIRIPAENLDSFVEHVSGVSNVVSSNEQIDDVTLTYVDTEARVEALKIEQERLMALMEKAESLSDLLEIESRLTDVNYQLESWASKLKALENQVSYATVHLLISEVQEYTPVAEKTTWERIAEGFMDSLEGIGDGAVEIFVWVLANSPYIVLFCGIAAVLIIRLRKWKKPVKKAPRKEKTEE